jgi:dihydroorotase
MITVTDVIRLGLKQLKWSNPEMFSETIINTEELEHSLLHDLKTMANDLQVLKEQQKIWEDRTNTLLLEFTKLKFILEDICHEASVREAKKQPKARRKP